MRAGFLTGKDIEPRKASVSIKNLFYSNVCRGLIVFQIELIVPCLQWYYQYLKKHLKQRAHGTTKEKMKTSDVTTKDSLAIFAIPAFDLLGY